MKSMVVATAALALFMSLKAQADSFSVVKDGKNYLCTSTEPRDPNNGVDCVNEAYSGPFSRDESVQLCAGAFSKAPATCAKKAYAGPFSKAESVDLCQRAESSGPADCAQKAYSGPFSKDEAVQLCRRNGTVANADCAIKAYAGPYSKAEAVRLCRNEPQLMIRSLHMMEQSREIQQKVQQLKQNNPVLLQ